MRIEMSDVHDVDIQEFLHEFVSNINANQTPIIAMNEALEASGVYWYLRKEDDSDEIYVVRSD